MRLEGQNERQLRWALQVYWQTQKEDAARPAPSEGEAKEVDELLQALEQSLGRGEEGEKGPMGKGDNREELVSPFSPSPVGPASEAEIADIFEGKQSQQVVENTGEVSEIGQNKPDLGHPLPGSVSTPEARVPDPAPLVQAARPKVQELLEQMQSDPEARALVESFLLSQMVQEESQQEEGELAALQRERQKREALEEGLEQMVAAQQQLESQHRRLRVRESEVAHQQVREQTKPAGAVMAQRREPTQQEIVEKISTAIGLRGPEEFLVSSEVEGMPDYNLTEEELTEFEEGRGWAWEEEQRRKREQERKPRESEKLQE